MNMDDSNGEGTHWVCYYNSPKQDYVEYFDSFGYVMPNEMVNFLDTSGKPIVYNSSEIQKNNSIACGYYCIDYICNRAKGKSMYDTIHQFDVWPSEHNEKLIHKLGKKLI